MVSVNYAIIIGMNCGICEPSLKSLIRPIFLPSITGATSVAVLTSFNRGTSKVFIMESYAFLISTPWVDSWSATKSNISCLTMKSGETKHMKTANCGRSVISVDSSRTKLNAIQFFKWFKKIIFKRCINWSYVTVRLYVSR